MAAAKKAAKKASAQPAQPATVTQLTPLRPAKPVRRDSRQELIDVAIDIIQNHGIDALRIDDVCERVGVSKGSLYWHFADRDGLVREALLEQLYRMGDEQLSVLTEAVDTAATRDEYLLRIAGAFVDPFDAAQVEARWQRLEMIAATRRDPKLSAIMDEVQQRHHRYLTDVMQKACERGILRTDVDPVAIAAMVAAIGLGSNVLSLLGDDGPTPGAWQATLLVVIDMLFPPA